MSDEVDVSPPVDCPKCSTRMTRVRVSDIDIDRCPICGGLWLDALEKDRILSVSGLAQAADTAATKGREHYNAIRDLACPRDQSRMLAIRDAQQRHIEYESCTICGGMFLDAGELKDLGEVTLRERLRMLFS